MWFTGMPYHWNSMNIYKIACHHYKWKETLATTISQKVPVNLCHLGLAEHDYFDYLTPFAFKYIMDKLSLGTKVRNFQEATSPPTTYTLNTNKWNLTVSTEKCQCDLLLWWNYAVGIHLLWEENLGNPCLFWAFATKGQGLTLTVVNWTLASKN